MCKKIAHNIKEVAHKLFASDNTFEQYLMGSQSIAELERREREWYEKHQKSSVGFL